MKIEPPISAEQWAQLRKLDSIANVSMRRGDARYNGEHERLWYVGIVPRDAEQPYYAGIRVERPTLAAALKEALYLASITRWTKPKAQ